MNFMPLRLRQCRRSAFALLCLALSATALADDHTATFEAIVDITWSAETVPFEFPASPHVTRFVGATLNSRYVLFRDGDTASSGLELVAENGRSRTLEAELADAMRRGRIGTVVTGSAVEPVPGQAIFRFTTTLDHPMVSFVAMIAPSPDWFTGLAGVPLRRNETWIDAQDYLLWVWDSGTDAGGTYGAADEDLQPQQSVRLLATPHFLTAIGLVPMGKVRIRRVQP